MTLRLRVDPVACDAFGHCAELAPQLISLDEWGYPVLNDHPLDRSEQKEVKRAISMCPRKALFLQKVADESLVDR
jgi:ferredoxin